MAEWLKHDQGLIAEECLTHWSAPTGLLIESFSEPHKQGLTHNYFFLGSGRRSIISFVRPFSLSSYIWFRNSSCSLGCLSALS